MKTYFVHVCIDCGVEVEKEYFEVPIMRDTHRTIRFEVDADTDTILHHDRAKDYKEPELRDDMKIWLHKKYKRHVDKYVEV